MGDRVDTYLDNTAKKTRRDIAVEKASAAAVDAKDAFEVQEVDEPRLYPFQVA